MEYKGRTDLYLKIGSKGYMIEAKYIYRSGNLDAVKSVDTVGKKLQLALNAASKNMSHNRKKLAILFIVPYFNFKNEINYSKHIRRWIEGLLKVKCSAIAWTFPRNALTRAHLKRNHVYPGIVVVIKQLN
jgi:hypothetical protein